MLANTKQVGGTHYKAPIECWDYIHANNIGYFEGTAIKYLTRWRKKGGVQDLEKAQHFIQKLIEVERAKEEPHKALTDVTHQWQQNNQDVDAMEGDAL